MKSTSSWAILFTLITVCCENLAFADSIPDTKPPPDQSYSTFYTIQDTNLQQGLTDPMQLVREIAAKVSTDIDLTAWSLHNSTLNLPTVAYNRLQDFGTWVVDHSLGGCENTRARVLSNSSSVPVTLSSGCSVTTGQWSEPYVGYTTTAASKLQIDHVVPLKHAYENGASNWDYAHRCVYANFLANDFDLMAVDGKANMQKGDMSPVYWMPSNAAFHCQYLKNWLSIKLIWGLAINPDEAAGLNKLLQSNNCDLSSFTFSSQELATERQYIEDKLPMCTKTSAAN